MRKILATMLGLGVLVGASNAAIITQFNFNSVPADANTATGRLLPNIGTGTASNVGGTSSGFSSGDANGGSSDPATGDDSGWQTSNYAQPFLGNKTTGVQFLVSTVGMKDITVSYDLRHSNTSARHEQFQYTLNGTTWVDSTLFVGAAGDTWFNGRSVNLSSIAGASNNANFGIRIVAAFAPGTTNYQASNPAGAYFATGTWRFDMVTVSGAAIPPPVPEPASILAVGAGLVGLARRKRSSK